MLGSGGFVLSLGGGGGALSLEDGAGAEALSLVTMGEEALSLEDGAGAEALSLVAMGEEVLSLGGRTVEETTDVAGTLSLVTAEVTEDKTNSFRASIRPLTFSKSVLTFPRSPKLLPLLLPTSSAPFFKFSVRHFAALPISLIRLVLAEQSLFSFGLPINFSKT